MSRIADPLYHELRALVPLLRRCARQIEARAWPGWFLESIGQDMVGLSGNIGSMMQYIRDKGRGLPPAWERKQEQP